MITRICLITPPSIFLLDERVFMTLGILKVAAVLEQAGVHATREPDGSQRLERLRADMEQLPDQQRIALVLRGMEGLDYEAIAEIMELSPAAVRTHVHLARKRLLSQAGEVDSI